MEWDSRYAAIRLNTDGASVHIVERPYIGDRYVKTKTYCGHEISLPIDECNQEHIDCQSCIEVLEKQQAFWKEFWSGADGQTVIKILSGYNRKEKKLKEIGRKIDALTCEVQELNNLIENCMQHHQPVFTLELPDEVLLKLADYGSVGEVLLAFKMSDETRKQLQTTLGKEGFVLLGSRLISKGVLKSNDPIFNHKW